VIKDKFVINFKKKSNIFLAITMATLLICSTLHAMVEDDSTNALGLATSDGNLLEMASLIEMGADVNSATIIDGQLKTPLFIAISRNNLKAVKFLVMKGAFIDVSSSNSPSQEDPLCLTPVHYAAMLGYENIFRALIMNGKSATEIAVINLRDHHGNTPLHYTARQGSESNTRLLLEKGANPNAINSLGYTPIFDAAFNGHAHIIQLLLESGVSLYLNDVRGIVHSALAAACSNGQVGAVEILLAKCTFTLKDITESIDRLSSFVRHSDACCTGKPKEAKCAKCLANEEKISHIFIALSVKQGLLRAI
jgi:ankyrin repeat protein